MSDGGMITMSEYDEVDYGHEQDMKEYEKQRLDEDIGDDSDFED